MRADGSAGDGRRWLAGLAGGPVHEDGVGLAPDGPRLGWIGPRPFAPDEAERLREAARFAAAPLAALTARATLTAALEAYLGRRSAARVLAGPLRRGVGETIEAALLFADLRGFTALSESSPPSEVISALDAWFDRIAGSVHAFGGEVLKFMGDGVLAIFPVAGRVAAQRLRRRAQGGRRRAERDGPSRRGAAARWTAAAAIRRRAASRRDAVGQHRRRRPARFHRHRPAVNLVSRLEGLCRPLERTVLISGAFAAATAAPLIPLGTHALRGIAAPCAVFTVPD